MCLNIVSFVQSALRLKPSFTDAYNNMASALVQKGLIPQAVECYNAALQINPNLVHNHAGSIMPLTSNVCVLERNACHRLHDCITVCDVPAPEDNVMSAYVTWFGHRLQGTLILLFA